MMIKTHGEQWGYRCDVCGLEKPSAFGLPDNWVRVPTEKREEHRCAPCGPALIREGWTLKRPPCASCGNGRLTPIAHDTGDGWSTGFECLICNEQTDSEEVDWPFTRDWATAEDFRRAGFLVV